MKRWWYITAFVTMTAVSMPAWGQAAGDADKTAKEPSTKPAADKARDEKKEADLAARRTLLRGKETLTKEERQEVDQAVKKNLDAIAAASTPQAVMAEVAELQKWVANARSRDFNKEAFSALTNHGRAVLAQEPPKDAEKAGVYVLKCVQIATLVADMAQPEGIRFFADAGGHRVQGVRFQAVRGLSRLAAAGGAEMAQACGALALIGQREDNSPEVLRAVYDGLFIRNEPVAAQNLAAVLDARLKQYAEGKVHDVAVEARAMEVIKEMIPPMTDRQATFVSKLIPLMRYVADEYVAAYSAYDDWKAKYLPEVKEGGDDLRDFVSPFKVKAESLEKAHVSPVGLTEFGRVRTRIDTAIRTLDRLIDAVLAVSKWDVADQKAKLQLAALSGDPQVVSDTMGRWIGPQGLLIQKYRVPVPVAARAIEEEPGARPASRPE